MERSIRVLALGILVGATLAGCSSSKSKAAPGTATTGGGQATTAATTSCHLDRAPKIVAMEEIKGESTVAIDDYWDAQKMAVSEINANGGVCGQQIDLERVSASATDAALATAALLRAEAMKPDFWSASPRAPSSTP